MKRSSCEIFRDLMVEDTPIMSLKFFGSRFLIKPEYLEFGIVEESWKSNGDLKLIAAVLIKSPLPVFIDIMQDKICPTNRWHEYKYKLFPCEPVLKDKLYVFKSDKREVELCSEYLKSFYCDRVLSPETSRIYGAISEDFVDKKAEGETQAQKIEPFFDTQSGRYAYRNSETGMPVYDANWGFKDGLALVSLNYKRGFINKKGKVVIPLKYDDAWEFHEGLAAVKFNGKWGFIDKTGKIIIPQKYDDVDLNYFGGKKDIATVKTGDKWGFIDRTGKEVMPPHYDKLFFPSYAYDAFALAKSDGKWGFVDSSGAEVIPPKYDQIREFDFEQNTTVQLNGKWGFIDRTGKEIIPLKYDAAWRFRKYQTNDNEYSEKAVALVKINEKYHIIDENGKRENALKVLRIDEKADIAVVELNGKQGILSWDYGIDRWRTPLKYDDIREYEESVAAVQLDGKWGFINDSGKEIIAPKFDDVNNFSEGLAAVRVHRKRGFIDTTGKKVIAFKYDAVEDFSDGKAKVTLGGETFYIDKQGNRID